MSSESQTSSFFYDFQEKLILWQLKGESELFSYLNLLRMGLPDKNLKSIGNDEAYYFNYYKSCFQLEMGCFIFLPVIGFFGYKFYREFKKPIQNPKITSIAFVRLLLSSVPAFNLFLFNSYRRYMHTIPCENALKMKYQHELRQIRRRKHELK